MMCCFKVKKSYSDKNAADVMLTWHLAGATAVAVVAVALGVEAGAVLVS